MLIYDDDRNKMLLWAAGSMSSTRLQKTVTILPGDGQEDELPHELVRQETAVQSVSTDSRTGAYILKRGTGSFSSIPQIAQEVAFKFLPDTCLERCC